LFLAFTPSIPTTAPAVAFPPTSLHPSSLEPMDADKTNKRRLRESDDSNNEGKRQRRQAEKISVEPLTVQATAASLFGQGLTQDQNSLSNEILMEGQHEVWNEGAVDDLSLGFMSKKSGDGVDGGDGGSDDDSDSLFH